MKKHCVACDKLEDVSRRGLCVSCSNAMTPIDRQNKIAREANQPHTLTLRQWRKTVAYFYGRCAYCREQHYTVIEHFIPISCGQSGTTVSNCVPACDKCNSRKRNLHPNQVTKIPAKDLERVRIFLEKQK